MFPDENLHNAKLMLLLFWGILHSRDELEDKVFLFKTLKYSLN